jgi:hypothetical protein
MDEVEPDDANVLPRYFPNASIVMTSRQQKDGHIPFHLPACLRQPVSIELEAQFVSMVPPPEDFASLFVLACPWHRSAWLAWLKHHGLPAPFRLSKWSADHAAAVLARFNRLSQLPTVRLGSPASVQGIEADFVIVERAACFNADLLDIALTRATRQLNSMKQMMRRHDRFASRNQHGEFAHIDIGILLAAPRGIDQGIGIVNVDIDLHSHSAHIGLRGGFKELLATRHEETFRPTVRDSAPPSTRS